jgi:hypothetical protein
MALAPVAYCLWQQFLRFDPQDPVWPNRDRFVLSIGHASMLLYSLLHLTEVQAVSKDYETLGKLSVPLDAIKAFRQLDSRCPGHPEYRWTSGVETTTISPDLLDQLEKTDGMLDRKLDPVKAQASKDERIRLDEKTFRWLHNEDAMATEKLAEGIRKFNSDARHLEDYALEQVKLKVA